jgi:hypothetical protein
VSRQHIFAGRARSAGMFSGFNPAASKDSPEEEKKMSERVRSWRPHPRTDLSEADIAGRPATHAWHGGGNLR